MGWAHHHINRILIVKKNQIGSIAGLKWYLSLVLPTCVSNIQYVSMHNTPWRLNWRQGVHKIHKIVFFFFKHFCVSRVCSTPCVTNLWSSCPTLAPAAQFSTSRRTTSSSSRLWCTKRLSSCRSCCLDTTWSVCAECQTQCGCWMRSKLRVYISCLFGESRGKYRSFLHVYSNKK